MPETTTLREIIRAGTLAPSIDNSQPWRFQIRDEGVALHLVPERAEFFGDYGYYAAHATLGGVVENMVVAAAKHGLHTEVRWRPWTPSGKPVAELRFEPALENESWMERPPLAMDKVARAVEARCTNRKPYARKPLDRSRAETLRELPLPEGVRFLLVEDRRRMRRLRRAAALADSVIFSHPRLHRGLFHWLRMEGEACDCEDGMPLQCLELPAPAAAFFRRLSDWRVQRALNRFGLARIMGLVNSGLLLSSSALGLVIARRPGLETALESGRLMERTWLAATALGLGVQPFGGVPFLLARLTDAEDHGFEPGHVRKLERVRDIVGEVAGLEHGERLVMLLRLGFAPRVSARTGRLGLERVVTN